MAVQSFSQPAGTFFERCSQVAHNTDHLLEGAFWGTWCVLGVQKCVQAISSRLALSTDPQTTPEKAQRVWEANKEVVLSSFSAFTGFSMVISWVGEVGLISLGAFGPIVGSAGYASSAIVSSAKSWDTLLGFNRGDTAFEAIQKLFRCAFYVSLAAWGVLGAVHTIVGGATLFLAMDKAFVYALYAFFGMFWTELFIPAGLECKKSLKNPSE